MTLNLRVWGNIKSAFLGLLFFGASQTALSQICGTGGPVAIPDGSGSTGSGGAATATIAVPAFYTNAITDFTFDLEINHTWVGDLIVTLTSPPPTPITVTLMNRPRSPADGIFGCGQDNINATFDEASGTPVENECPNANPTISGVLNPDGDLDNFVGEIPAGDWTLTVTDNAGFDTGSIIPTGSCLDFTTVPVVLSSFSSRQKGQRIVTEWQTASEAFNLGFHVWGNIDGDWTQLNNRLIRSGAVDSVEPLDYRRVFDVSRLPSPPTEIGISSVSSAGHEEFYGPFEIGERYGEITVPKPIDWSAQREKHKQAMQQAGYQYRHGRWRKASRRSQRVAAYLQKRFPDSWLRIEEDGVYRVTYEELLANGIDLGRLPIWRIALSNAGQPVARRIKGSTRRPWRFGPGAEIVFYAQTPKGADSRYADYNNIRISTNSSMVLRAPYIRSQRPSDPELASTSHIKTVSFGEPTGYSFIVPGDDPWYDEVIYAFGSIGTKRMDFTVSEQGLLNEPVHVAMNLMGGTSFDNIDVDGDGEVEPDHHFKVYLNRDRFPEPIYEGFSEMVDAVNIQAEVQGQLLLGDNSLELEVIPDNGHNLDAAYFLDGRVSFHTENILSENNRVFELGAEQEWLAVNDSSATVDRVYMTDSVGNFSQLATQRTAEALIFKAPAAIGESTHRKAWLTGSTGLLSAAEFSPAPVINTANLNLENIDYVIIADPSLIGNELNRYTELQTELGRRVKVVNTHDIYATFSEGIETPSAIAAYLKSASLGSDTTQPSPFEYVLLVGGHTYNYLGFNVSAEERPINLIPSFYRNGAESINRQIPTAVPFVDFDADGAPDKAIGRWPVRDTQQLKMVVDKTITWHQQGSNKDNRETLLIAQKNEDLNNFSASLERVNSTVGHTNSPWLVPNRIYVSDILADATIDAEQKINQARERLVTGINQGPALTVYAGHASPTTWGRENLLTTTVVDRFTNHDQPTLIIPLACYTTYYETPKVKSLSERLFSDNPAGAVGLSGPALLSYNVRFRVNSDNRTA